VAPQRGMKNCEEIESRRSYHGSKSTA